jgi:amino acid permease
MTQSILTDLAEDQSIFESLLQRKIFQSWIWYWITLYGVTVLLLLTLVSLVMSWLHPNTSTWVLCSSIATVAALHLILGVGLGYKILKITRRIVQEIIHLHRQTVASMLRDQIHRTGAQAT